MYYSIKKRLVIGVICILLATLLPAGLYLVYLLRAEVRQDARDVAVNVLHGTQWALSGHTPFTDAKDLDVWAKGFEAATGVRLSYIVKGRLVADSQLAYDDLPSTADHSARPEVMGALKKGLGVDTRFSTTVGKRFIYAALATDTIPGQPAGVLRIAMPDLAISARLDKAEWHMAAIVIGVFCLGSLLLGLLLLRMFRYLDDLTQTVRAIGKGDYSRRMPETRCRELVPFVVTMNVMAANIEQYTREMSEEKAQLETVLNAMKEGVLVLDERGRVARWNRAAEAMFAGTEHNAASPGGKLLMEVVMNARVQEKASVLLQAMARGDAPPFAPAEPVRIVRQDGKAYLASLIPLPAGGAAKLMLVFTDVGERERLDAIRRDFVANVSHELRTPLTNIRGYTELMQDNPAMDPAKRAEFLETIARNVAHMTRMTDGLLTLARAEHAAAGGIRDTADASAALRMTLREFAPMFAEKAVRVHCDIPDTALDVTGDTDSLHEIFRNLLENAVKYGGGGIDVAARVDGENAVITVRDYGPGIPEASRERIFERFYRLERPAGKEKKSASGSVGLGLAICRHIALNLGGSITVDAPGGGGPGSVFIVTLRLRDGGDREPGKEGAVSV